MEFLSNLFGGSNDEGHGHSTSCEKETLPDGTVLIIETWEDGSTSVIEQPSHVAETQRQVEENDFSNGH